MSGDRVVYNSHLAGVIIIRIILPPNAVGNNCSIVKILLKCII